MGNCCSCNIQSIIKKKNKAITGLNLKSAKDLLMGGPGTCTKFLRETCTSALRGDFIPIVQDAVGKVGANKMWESVKSKYNKVPGVKPINVNEKKNKQNNDARRRK